MEIGEIKTLDYREGSSIASTWSEYLCIQRMSCRKYDVFVGGYEVIGEVSDFYDEEQDEEIIPDQIDGCDVVGVEDGYIVGGEIVRNEGEGQVTISKNPDQTFDVWLEELKWKSDKVVPEIRKLTETSLLSDFWCIVSRLFR
jgi:hypothetical protein